MCMAFLICTQNFLKFFFVVVILHLRIFSILREGEGEMEKER